MAYELSLEERIELNQIMLDAYRAMFDGAHNIKQQQLDEAVRSQSQLQRCQKKMAITDVVEMEVISTSDLTEEECTLFSQPNVKEEEILDWNNPQTEKQPQKVYFDKNRLQNISMQTSGVSKPEQYASLSYLHRIEFFALEKYFNDSLNQLKTQELSVEGISVEQQGNIINKYNAYQTEMQKYANDWLLALIKKSEKNKSPSSLETAKGAGLQLHQHLYAEQKALQLEQKLSSTEKLELETLLYQSLETFLVNGCWQQEKVNNALKNQKAIKKVDRQATIGISREDLSAEQVEKYNAITDITSEEIHSTGQIDVTKKTPSETVYFETKRLSCSHSQTAQQLSILQRAEFTALEAELSYAIQTKSKICYQSRVQKGENPVADQVQHYHRKYSDDFAAIFLETAKKTQAAKKPADGEQTASAQALLRKIAANIARLEAEALKNYKKSLYSSSVKSVSSLLQQTILHEKSNTIEMTQTAEKSKNSELNEKDVQDLIDIQSNKGIQKYLNKRLHTADGKQWRNDNLLPTWFNRTVSRSFGCYFSAAEKVQTAVKFDQQYQKWQSEEATNINEKIDSFIKENKAAQQGKLHKTIKALRTP